MFDEAAAGHVLDFTIGHGEIAASHRLIALEIVADLAVYGGVKLRPCRMGGAPGHLHEFAVAYNDPAILEHIVGLGEHRLAIPLIGINDDVGGSARPQMAAVRKAEDARRAGASQDGDLVKRVLAADG